VWNRQQHPQHQQQHSGCNRSGVAASPVVYLQAYWRVQRACAHCLLL
jgi:hypothetical protein